MSAAPLLSGAEQLLAAERDVMSIDDVLARLESITGVAATKSSTGYRTKCPVHDGISHDSLSVSESNDGTRVLLHCFSGCPFESIVEAAGLHRSNLCSSNGDRNAGALRVAAFDPDEEKCRTDGMVFAITYLKGGSSDLPTRREAVLSFLVDDYGEKARDWFDAGCREQLRSGKDTLPSSGSGDDAGNAPDAAQTSESAPATGYELAPLDWQALLRDGVPEIEYIREPYLPKGARIWVWGQTGSMKSLWCEHEAASLSREGVRVAYFAEENPIAEELRRISRLQPNPEYFRLFHRSGMDLLDEKWIDALLRTTQGDNIIFLDSWTDLWSGDENDNRAVQMFDAAVLKPLQRQGVTPVVIHHMGHRYMFSDRGGATAGRGASSLGQKADVTLEFKSSGENLFTIVYGKSRIGGLHHPERSYKVEDTDDGRVEIVEGESPEDRAVAELAEKMAQAVLTAPRGYLTTNELRVAVGGSRTHQAAALVVIEDDPRVAAGVEKVETKDGKRRDSKVWRSARGVVAACLPFTTPKPRADESSESSTPTPLKEGGEGRT